MIDLKVIQNSDPLKRVVERQADTEEFSPMEPPDAYAPPAEESMSYEEMPTLIKTFMDEHKNLIAELEKFEDVLARMREEGMTKEIAQDGTIAGFFRYFDEHVIPHNVREEKILFPSLQERLLETGEHSQGDVPTSAVDMMEDDHVKLLQLAAVAFNMFGLAVRLPDPASRAVTLDVALEQSSALVEMLRLHIFREDHVVFPMAAKHLTEEELAGLEQD